MPATIGVIGDETVALFAFVFAIGVLALLVPMLVLQVVGEWKVLTKAGEQGWKCLIPFYGEYTFFSIVKKKNTFWWYLGFSLVDLVLTFMMEIVTIINLYESTGMGTMVADVLSAISSVISIALVVIWIRFSLHLSRAFGHGGGFAVGLFLLPFIFMMILGFGKSEYIADKTDETEDSTMIDEHDAGDEQTER